MIDKLQFTSNTKPQVNLRAQAERWWRLALVDLQSRSDDLGHYGADAAIEPHDFETLIERLDQSMGSIFPQLR